MTIVLIAAALYLVSTALLIRGLAGERSPPPRNWLVPTIAAVLLHAGYHLMVAMKTAGGPDMHFFAALSLVGLGMAALTAVVGARGRMSALGVVVFPMAAILLLAYHGYGHEPSKLLGWRLATHAWLALLAYATLSVAALLAIMLWLQERALRRRCLAQPSPLADHRPGPQRRCLVQGVQRHARQQILHQARSAHAHLVKARSSLCHGHGEGDRDPQVSAARAGMVGRLMAPLALAGNLP